MGTLVRLAATKSCIHGRVGDRTIVKSLFNEFQPHSPAADNPEQLRTTSIEWLLAAAVSAATILLVVWLAGIALSAVVVFEATEEGTHTIEFSIDGASESLPLHVVENAA